MTEAVAYAFHCLGQEGLHTSLKPEKRVSSTSTMVVWSGCLHKHQLEAPQESQRLAITCTEPSSDIPTIRPS